jgi:hypothetical protein
MAMDVDEEQETEREEAQSLIFSKNERNDDENEDKDSQKSSCEFWALPLSSIFENIIQGGNLISGCLFIVGKAYWPVAYVAQAGCTLITSDIFKKIIRDSSWAWKECRVRSPCDEKLASPKLCLLDQIGDYAGYINLGGSFVYCAIVGYKNYKANQEYQLRLNRLFS